MFSSHDMLWEHDSGGLQKRMNKLLSLTEKHKIKVIFVLFDSSGNPIPNWAISGSQSLAFVILFGCRVLERKGLPIRSRWRKCSIMRRIGGQFRHRPAVLAWDVWNEPDNTNAGHYTNSEPPNKAELVRDILPKIFQYVRAGSPTQPITSGLWRGDWSSAAKLTPIETIQVDLSDILSFQNYDGPEEFEKRVKWLQAFGRPVIRTGFLDRSHGSTFEAILPIAEKYDVGVLAGDLVAGKTQRWLPTDSWQSVPMWIVSPASGCRISSAVRDLPTGRKRLISFAK